MWSLDAAAQIRLFRKLTLAKCAPILELPEIGFFVDAEVGKPDAGHRDMP